MNEWTKPISPVASAVRTSVSGTCRPWSTRSSKGLFASKETGYTDRLSFMLQTSAKSSINQVQWLFSSQSHEVYCVAGHADRPVRARTHSARLVRMTEMLAPRTRPALSALARNVGCLARMLPASKSGANKMSGSPATSERMPFHLHVWIRHASMLQQESSEQL